jgi:hypothetical protein
MPGPVTVPNPHLHNDGSQSVRAVHKHDMTELTCSGFVLTMRQQPERARLCSFKEENDTSMSSISARARRAPGGVTR